MKLHSFVLSIAAFAVPISIGCSDLASQCASVTPTPGADCNADSLQCPYSFDQPNCDGTTTTMSSSCFCTGGAWSCPSPAALADCPAPTDDGGGGDDGATE